jgi:DNA polymerase-3 subunit epsilon
MQRQIVLDTETTGLNPEEGHRIIEIGCVELLNRRLTGQHFHVYLNPDRHIDDGAIEVHGITNEFLENKPRFGDIADDFISFVQGAELLIHNAPFDVSFLNHEFFMLNNRGAIETFCSVFDTLAYARKKHPGQRNSLDALCKRYGIDNSHRDLHGALLDAEILADVYLLMTGGQSSLLEDEHNHATAGEIEIKRLPSNRPSLKIVKCSAKELQLHQQKLEAITKDAGHCLWQE